MHVQTFQKLGLNLLGIPYVLGAEDDLGPELPAALDCSELVQRLISAAGAPQIGDLAAAQWDKTTPVATTAALPMVGGVVAVKNNRARANRIGHIGLTIGRAKTYRYVLEARGREFGTVLTRLQDFHNPRLRYGTGPMGIYKPLKLTGDPLRLVVWRGIRPTPGVGAAQRQLRELGFKGSKGTLRVDDDFGAQTQQAVRAFERSRGMLPSGAITTDVRDAIRLALTH